MICLIVIINLRKPRKATVNMINQLLFEIKLRNWDEVIFSDPKYYQVLELVRMRQQIFSYITGTYNAVIGSSTVYNYIIKSNKLVCEEV
jgi:hypothetical protein